MPIEWRPDIPVALYIANKQNYSTAKCVRRCQIFNERCQIPLKLIQLAKHGYTNSLNASPKYNPDTSYGTLEIQKLILQQLARQENTVKELISQNETGQKVTDAECEVTVRRLVKEKKEIT
jgi:hypothetical protein